MASDNRALSSGDTDPRSPEAASPEIPTVVIQFRPGRLGVFLGSIVGCLVVANIVGLVSTYVFGHGGLLGLVRLFNMDEEANIPTYFTSLELLFCSGLLVLIGVLNERRGDRYHRYWKALGGVFLYLSIDEVAQLHEISAVSIERYLPTFNILPFSWVLPYGIAGIVLLIIFLRFIAQLPTRTRWLTLLAAFVYVGGAMEVESIEGYYFGLLAEKEGYVLRPYDNELRNHSR